ncbi:hypothetical protein [Rhodovibrio sodomensis]|uniref:hypothetical protein n=1 Tax=Rhodovibrio sodomensis TaxID=1088 RepID=UPI0019084C54|nr:hypothetical protein [Rhodovibrio sodomensis]
MFTRDRLNRFGLSVYDAMFTTIAGTTLVKSVGTVAANLSHDGVSQPYFDNGQLTANEMSEQVAREGMRARFRQSLDNYMNRRFRAYEPSDRAWREFEKALKELRRRDVKVLIFIPPTHVAHLESIRLRGLWPQWVDFKRRLAQRTSYWDFSGVNAVTTEPIADEMSFYWDISHFRSRVGDRILAQFFDQKALGNGQSQFGQHVTAQTLAQRLSEEKEALARWRARHPSQAEFVQRQLRNLGKPVLRQQRWPVPLPHRGILPEGGCRSALDFRPV